MESYGVMALWHGGSWKFIVGEGWWFWLVIILEQITEPIGDVVYRKFKISRDNKLVSTARMAKVFFCFSIGMVFFRSNSLIDAFRMLVSGMDWSNTSILIMEWIAQSGILNNMFLFLLAMIGILFVWIGDGMNYVGKSFAYYWDKLPPFVRMAGYWCICIIMIYLFCDMAEAPAFIYNQF